MKLAIGFSNKYRNKEIMENKKNYPDNLISAQDSKELKDDAALNSGLIWFSIQRANPGMVVSSSAFPFVK